MRKIPLLLQALLLLLFAGCGRAETPADTAYAPSAVEMRLCGYLAGRIAVGQGYTRLGCIETQTAPGREAYAEGFVSGADAAAEKLGGTVQMYRITVRDAAEASETAEKWKRSGVEALFTADGMLAASLQPPCFFAGTGSPGGNVLSCVFHAEDLSPKQKRQAAEGELRLLTSFGRPGKNLLRAEGPVFTKTFGKKDLRRLLKELIREAPDTSAPLTSTILTSY